jgi:hypothetical protein
MRRVAIAGLALVASAAEVRAQEDVSALIRLVEKQPDGMDRAAWKEKRREAARKLIASGDKRAVPVLARVAEGESFDIIGEIAIEGLGKLGDPSAAPALERIAGDNSRDRAQREMARKALARLGAKPPVPTPTPTPTPTPPVPTPTPQPPRPDPGTGSDPDVDIRATPGTEPVVRRDPVLGGSTEVTGAPSWDEDVLAATESLTFAFGAASLSFDTLRDRVTFDVDAEGLYARRIERERSAWGMGVDVDVVGGVFNPTDAPDRAGSKMAVVDVSAGGDFRAYTASGVYGVAEAAANLRGHYITVRQDDPNNDILERRLAADLGVAIGGGHGRLLDVGTRMRAQQIAAVLERARALGRPIDDSLARKLQATWWALRRDRTGYRQLTATVAVLRDAGVLLGEPDAGTTYELLEVLRDPSFDGRPSGVDAQLLVAESFVMRQARFGGGITPGDVCGEPQGSSTGCRFETALVRARAAKQLGLANDAFLTLDGRYQLTGDVKPWQVEASGRWRRFVHGDHAELLGTFDVGAALLASDDGGMDSRKGARVMAEVGWTWTLNRASGVRLAGTGAFEGGAFFVGASLEASYGFLDGGFARSLPPGL